MTRIRFPSRWPLVLALIPSAVVVGPDDFRMTVQDIFAVTGRGVVVAGRVGGGPVAVNDVVCLRPVDGERRELTVAGIEQFRQAWRLRFPEWPSPSSSKASTRRK